MGRQRKIYNWPPGADPWRDMPDKKRCIGCKEWKPRTPDSYHRNRTMCDGLNHVCKDCKRLEKAKYRERTNARHRARMKALERLGDMYPEMFDRLYREEALKVGIRLRYHRRQELMVDGEVG